MSTIILCYQKCIYINIYVHKMLMMMSLLKYWYIPKIFFLFACQYNWKVWSFVICKSECEGGWVGADLNFQYWNGRQEALIKQMNKHYTSNNTFNFWLPTQFVMHEFSYKWYETSNDSIRSIINPHSSTPFTSPHHKSN